MATALAIASPAQATFWQAANNCWQDFDVGGGRFCGLRVEQLCPTGTNALKCSDSIPLDIPPPYSSTAPASKLVALDSSGRVYLVGNDDQIYWERGGSGNFGLFFSQPPVNCINKLVVLGSGLYGQYLFVRACDSQGSVYTFSRALGWVRVLTNSTDISSFGGDPATDEGWFYSLDARGVGKLSGFLAGRATAGLSLTGTNPTWSGSFGPAQAVRIGGGVAILQNYFESCAGPWDSFSPSLFENIGYGTFVNANSPGFIAAADPGGCPNLQLPGGANVFATTPSPLVTKITSTFPGQPGGPGDDILWVLTNTTRIYALTRTNSRQ